MYTTDPSVVVLYGLEESFKKDWSEQMFSLSYLLYMRLYE